MTQMSSQLVDGNHRQQDVTTGLPKSATPLRREGPATLHRFGGLNVVRLDGDFYEMGRQHGVLLRDQIPQGPIPYYRRHLEKLLGPALGPASGLAWPALQTLIGRRVAKALPPFAQDTIRGIADGAGMPHQAFVDGCTMPDALLWVAARVMQVKNIGPAVAHRIALGLGCTSAMAWGSATKDGKLYHARNFDYHGVGCWPSTATLLFHNPKNGQRYVSVAAAGVGLGGITAMNEAGLTLTVHQHMFTAETRLGGTPIGVVGDIVMREAKNLDDAERILRQHRPIGCWTYLITDGIRKEVLCWEENPDRQVAMRHGGNDNPTFGYANIYLDPELGATERNLYGSYWRHNQGRHQRVCAEVEQRAGNLDAAGMAEILAHTGDGGCRLRNSIAMALTVGSVVFRPEDGLVWVGTGEAPTSHGTFHAFSLKTMGPVEDASFEAGPNDGPSRQGFEYFRQAYLAYTDHSDAKSARALMQQATDKQPKEHLYHWLSGMMALLSDDTSGAVASLEGAVELGHVDPERLANAHMWLARALDINGDRSRAVQSYRQALSLKCDPPVYRAAERGLSNPFTAKGLRTTHVDFGLADVVAP